MSTFFENACCGYHINIAIDRNQMAMVSADL
jgi:hypothetical protein